MNRPIASRYALVHHLRTYNPVQAQNVLVGERLFASMLFREAQARQVVEHFPLRSCANRNLTSLLDRPHLLQGERVPLDRS